MWNTTLGALHLFMHQLMQCHCYLTVLNSPSLVMYVHLDGRVIYHPPIPLFRQSTYHYDIAPLGFHSSLLSPSHPSLMTQDECDHLKKMLREKPRMMKDEKMLWFCIQEKVLPSEDVDAWAKEKKSFLSQLATCGCKSPTPKQLKCFQVKREDAWKSGEWSLC